MRMEFRNKPNLADIHIMSVNASAVTGLTTEGTLGGNVFWALHYNNALTDFYFVHRLGALGLRTNMKL